MTLRYLALGDSYTIGEGVPERARWPLQLARALRAEGIALADPQIVAATGWTTDALDAAIDAIAPQGPFALVSLLIGVNDQYRGYSLTGYRQRFGALLARALGFAGGHDKRVLVLSIPDWGVTSFAVAQGRDPLQTGQEIDQFNAAAADICASRGIAVVDITSYSRARGAEPAMLAADGLHPSAAMYAGWTRRALAQARSAFR